MSAQLKTAEQWIEEEPTGTLQWTVANLDFVRAIQADAIRYAASTVLDCQWRTPTGIASLLNNTADYLEGKLDK